jgi:hypothetical protein
VPFAQQPVLQVRDQFGNLRSSANGVTNSTVVTAARGNGSGTLQGTLTTTTTDGVATFTDLSHNVAANITLAFSATGVSSTNSSAIAVSPAAADHLVFTTQPGSTTYGAALISQPALKTQDQFGNDSTVGLGASKMVSLTVSAGTGSLPGHCLARHRHRRRQRHRQLRRVAGQHGGPRQAIERRQLAA